MLSVLRSVALQQPSSPFSNDPQRVKFKTVLGFSAVHKDLPSPSSPHLASRPDGKTHSARRSVDFVANHSFRRKQHRDRSSVTDVSFVDSQANVDSTPDSSPPSDMKRPVGQQSPMTARRIPFRLDGQDGPWAVSVAENDASSYSLYIKTPTHNLTLTRTAQEVLVLHGKLRDSYPAVKLPMFPIDASMVPTPPKRKSAFLNTLSRLASPASSKNAGLLQVSGRQPYAGAPTSSATSSVTSSTISANRATPIAMPVNEIGDPFEDDDSDLDIPTGAALTNGTITGLAAYLTSLANEPTLRQARVWKRFVRVRTDDLQSVRVERAIKRVRSDLAAHVSPSSSGEVHRSISQVVMNGHKATATEAPAAPSVGTTHAADKATVVDGTSHADIQEEDEGQVSGENGAEGVAEDGMDGEIDRAPTPRSPKPLSTLLQEATMNVTLDSALDGALDGAEPYAQDDAVNGDDNGPSTPVSSEALPPHGARIPRSQSADPTSRASRIFISSPLPCDSEPASSEASQAGDDSSVSTTGRRVARRKRSKSMDPNSEKKKSQRKLAIDDFEMMRVLGKGCAGKVLLVRHKPTSDVFALKAITKRHVLAHQELQHTLTEQAVLKRMAAEGSDPFVVKLWWSFHDKENLFLVMDFHPGGDLATQLARWGRLGRDRARFYAAEIVEGVEGLHAAGVIYRDLKPENILIGGDGHIVLTDFGLSKEFPRRTSPTTTPPTPSGFRGDFTAGTPTAAVPHWMKAENGQDMANGWAPSGPVDSTSTFCGTAEYLAPEVIQGLPYGYEVDWWSFGTMLYEMLTGITPFWASNHSDMYYRVLQDELQFPEDRTMDQDTKSLIRGLLQRNPALRMKEPRIKKHPYFSMIDWSHVYYKRYIPPYVPPIDPSNASDTQNFDDTFLDMEPVINDENENELTDTDQDRQTDADRTDGEDSVTTPSQSRSPSVHPMEDESVDVFDGYSFKGRHSVIIDEDAEDEDGEDDDEEEEEEEEEEESVSASVDSLLQDESSFETAPAEAVEESRAAEEAVEPKTPEARTAALPEPVPVSVAAAEEPQVVEKPEITPRASNETTGAETVHASPVDSAPVSAPPPAVPAREEVKPQAKPAPKVHPVRIPPSRQRRREKSGIPALDRDFSDTIDEDEAATEHDDEDDWDFVETNVVEERNGAKGTSLFARGVVDRYKLAVFRKSTPRRSAGSSRNFSGISVESDLAGSEASESPTPSEKHRRGRNPGLTFRKHPKQFLRQKSPPPLSRSSTATAKTLSHSTSATLSASTTSSAGLLSPSPSQTSTLPLSPSLKSKESAISMGSPSESSDQSVNGDARNIGGDILKGTSLVSVEEEKQKSKVLKKYKEGAEKVLSIFQSPK